MESQIDLLEGFNQEVAQHNNLIFAPFALGSLENRIFIAMLERTNRFDSHFSEPSFPNVTTIHVPGIWSVNFPMMSANSC
jgi:hypothetical protein